MPLLPQLSHGKRRPSSRVLWIPLKLWLLLLPAHHNQRDDDDSQYNDYCDLPDLHLRPPRMNSLPVILAEWRRFVPSHGLMSLLKLALTLPAA